MNVVFLYGPPGVGKLTIAKQLAGKTGFKLFHNHLTVDLVYAVFDFGTKPFIELREKIWMMVFEKAKAEKIKGIVFTFAPEKSVSDHFIPDLIHLIEDKDNKIFFTELTCTPDELRKRIIDPSRKKYAKSMDTEVEKYLAREHMIPEIVHERKFVLDNTDISPSDAADKIINHFRLIIAEI